jgi:tRNA threonylcarbamoyladenosine biosynthesis protein TsaE
VRVVSHTSSAAETIELGRALALQLKAGDVVAFYGDLGAGKTTMIKGVAAGLGVADVVRSPSFVIVTEYRGRIGTHHQDTKTRRGQDGDGNRQGRQERQGSDGESKRPPLPFPPPSRGREQREGVPVYHIDLYRLTENSDFESIGLDSYLEGDGVCLIEWAERAEKVLPDNAIRVRMSVEGSGRRIEIAGLRAPLQPVQ